VATICPLSGKPGYLDSWAAPPARCAAPSAHIRFGSWRNGQPC